MVPLAAETPTEPEGFTVETAAGVIPEEFRYELHGGRIHVMVPPAFWHSDAQVRLVNLLRSRGKIANPELGLKIAPRETRIIDVAVLRAAPDPDRAYFAAGEIELAVEVVSPGSVDDDYLDKPVLYAKLGIPEFWRVDRRDGELLVEQFTLDPAAARYGPARTVRLDELESD